MKAEQKFNRFLQNKLPGHVQRIESTTGNGIPDLNVCYKGKEIWIESKIRIPGKGVLLRKEQVAWGWRRFSNSGRVFIFALNKDVIEIWSFHTMSTDNYSKYFRINSLPELIVEKKKFSKIIPWLFDLQETSN